MEWNFVCLFFIIFAKTNGVEIFSFEPLSYNEPPWNPQEHSSPPGNLFAQEFIGKPLPTNTWWLNLGKITDCWILDRGFWFPYVGMVDFGSLIS